MILNGTFSGMSFLTNAVPVPIKQTYNKLIVNGELIVDKIRVLDTLLTTTQIDNLLPTDEYNWTANTLMYAEFNDNMNAGNISGINTPIVAFDVFRREDGDIIFTKIDELPANAREYTDFAVVSDESYSYRFYARTETEIANPISIGPILTDFYSWSLTNPITQEVYLFDLNVSSGAIQNNSDMYVYNNMYTEKPKVSFSDKKYISGSLNAMAGAANCDGTLYYPRDYLDRLNNFINDKNPKYLKSRRGDIWVVMTNNFNYKYVDEIGEQLANISFDFVEVDGTDGSEFIRLS